MDNTYTEGIERFKKVVDFMGLYIPEDEQMLIDQNMLEEADESGDYPAVHAYVNKECYEGQRGFLLACQDEAVYMCIEAQYDGENLYCEGSVPSWTYSDEMLIQHLGEMVKEYKREIPPGPQYVSYSAVISVNCFRSVGSATRVTIAAICSRVMDAAGRKVP